MSEEYGCACRWVADKGQVAECATHANLRAEVERLRLGRDRDTKRLTQAWSEVERLRGGLEEAQKDICSNTAAYSARVRTLEEALREVRDNWDCDEDAHKHGTRCRCCVARSALAGEGKA
jgi:hypothetical protein